MKCQWTKCDFEDEAVEKHADHLKEVHGVKQTKEQLISTLNTVNSRGVPNIKSVQPEELELGNIVIEYGDYKGHPMLGLKWHKDDDRTVFNAGGSKWLAILTVLKDKEGRRLVEEFVKEYAAK